MIAFIDNHLQTRQNSTISTETSANHTCFILWWDSTLNFSLDGLKLIVAWSFTSGAT
jgi:hypothetical protein